MIGANTKPITMISVRFDGPSDGDAPCTATMTSGSARTASMIAAEDVVDHAAEVARDEPERGAEDGAEQRRERRDEQDVARADDDAREHVAAELVGAEPVVARSAPPGLLSGFDAYGSCGTMRVPKIAQTHPEADDDRARP